MNAKEHAEKLAAARAELARLEAIAPEKEKPGMVLPMEDEISIFGWLFGGTMINMADEDQYNAYEDAFLTMLLMRAQKGIVSADNGVISVYAVFVGIATKLTMHATTSIFISACMFPCFATEADARAAIAAVGEDRIIRCAKWLAGCA